MPPRGERAGDVRINPHGRNRVEILVPNKRGGLVWVPYLQHAIEELVGCCPNCNFTARLRDFA